MSGALKVAAVAVAAAICAVAVKKQTPELGIALVLAAGAVLLGFALSAVEQVTDFLDELAQTAGLMPAVLTPVLKVTGIAVVSRTASELCKDAREGGLASFVDTAATALALTAAMPLLRTVLSTITELME